MKEKGKAKIGYEDFFDVFDGYYVLACHSNRTDLHLNIEDLYQAFKQRLMAELSERLELYFTEESIHADQTETWI